MKLLTTASTTNTRRFWIGLTGLVALLAIVVAAGLTRELYLDLQPQSTAPVTSVGVSAPLDAHERHLTANTDVPALLDLHERHGVASSSIRAPLDAHERHMLDVSVRLPAPLDLHDRHRTAPVVNVGITAALDLHERHQKAPAALDLHERHRNSDDQ